MSDGNKVLPLVLKNEKDATANPSVIKTDRIAHALFKIRTELGAITLIQEVKDALDFAAAARLYATRRRLSASIGALAREIEIRAKIRLGEILAATEKNCGSAGTLAGRDASGGYKFKLLENKHAPTLREIGIPRRLSAESQKLARLSDDMKQNIIEGRVSPGSAIHMEEKIARGATLEDVWVNTTRRVARSGYYEEARQWTTRILAEFCEMGISASCAETIASNMTPKELATIHGDAVELSRFFKKLGDAAAGYAARPEAQS